MAEWSRDKVNSQNINDGQEYDKSKNVSLEQLNAMVNAGLYAQDFAEKLVENIDTSEIGKVGIPSVTLIDGDNATTSKPYKKFKFANLKGAKGDKGDKGDAGDLSSGGDVQGDINLVRQITDETEIGYKINGDYVVKRDFKETSATLDNIKGNNYSHLRYNSKDLAFTSEVYTRASQSALDTTNSNVATNTNDIATLNTNKANKSELKLYHHSFALSQETWNVYGINLILPTAIKFTISTFAKWLYDKGYREWNNTSLNPTCLWLAGSDFGSGSGYGTPIAIYSANGTSITVSISANNNIVSKTPTNIYSYSVRELFSDTMV